MAASRPGATAGVPALSLARRVIGVANREHPADAVLRQELKAQRRLSSEEARRVSGAVFAYYRWRGWLESNEGSEADIRRALSMSERFARKPQTFSDAELAARAVPAWLGQQMEITPGWVRALQTEPKLWLRARAGQGKALAKRLGDCRVLGEGCLAEILEYHGTRDLFRTPEFHAGQFELQDISSQVVGIMCGARPGETWWDSCAGEGGKTLQLSDLMENRGLIWASDRAGWRLQRLKRRAARARAFNYRSAPWDGGAKLPIKTKFDGILIDAPCSGIGTWHRNPHARWTTTFNDVRELAALQLQLLSNAAGSVKPGGKLIYAVCTLTRRETVEVAKTFGQLAAGFDPLPVTNPLSPAVSSRAETFLLPQDSGGNGMYVAAWRRR